MKGKIALISLLLMLFGAAGCWNRVELDQRAIVAGFGADKAGEEGKIKVTVQVIKPGELKVGPTAKGGSPPAVTVYTSEGYTFFDTVRNLAMASGKKQFISEAKILVVGEDLAREGIGWVTDMYDRDHEMSTRNFLLVARGEAKDVLETEVGAEKIWAYGISQKVRSMAAHAKSPDTEIRHFLSAVESKTMAPVAAAVQVVHKEKGEEKAEESKATLSKDVIVSGTAVFRHYKLKGWLDEKETRGMLWTTGEVKSGIVVVPAPGSGGKPVALEIIRADSEIKPEIKDGNITITVKVNEQGNVGEVQPDSVDITKPGVLEELEERKKAAIEDEIMAAVVRAQELNADIFGFGEEVRRKYPGQWKNMEDKWDELFPGLEVIPEVDAKIRRTGKITKPAQPKP